MFLVLLELFVVDFVCFDGFEFLFLFLSEFLMLFSGFNEFLFCIFLDVKIIMLFDDGFDCKVFFVVVILIVWGVFLVVFKVVVEFCWEDIILFLNIYVFRFECKGFLGIILGMYLLFVICIFVILFFFIEFILMVKMFDFLIIIILFLLVFLFLGVDFECSGVGKFFIVEIFLFMFGILGVYFIVDLLVSV